jgi:hypothetical protein
MPFTHYGPGSRKTFAHTPHYEIGADEPSRHLTGVEIRPGGNYGGENASGIWGGSWGARIFGAGRKASSIEAIRPR